MLSILNNNCFIDRNGYQAKYIILHGTAIGTNAEVIANNFKDTEGTNDPVSAHYVIGTDGEVVQCNLEKDGAYANGFISGGPSDNFNHSGYGNGYYDPCWNPSVNPNFLTVAIEHCKPSSDNSNVLTEAQKNASFGLILDICDRNGIPKQWADGNGGVTGHFSIDPINRSNCPGIYPWDELFSFLNGNNIMTIPNGWTDDGTVLKAPNGISVVLGFRSYILNNNWDANNLPLEVEHGRNPVESYYHSTNGSVQTFNYCRLCYTTERGVYVEGIGNELLGCEKDLALLQNSNNQTIKDDVIKLAKDFKLL